jgi:hypothetical protein
MPGDLHPRLVLQAQIYNHSRGDLRPGGEEKHHGQFIIRNMPLSNDDYLFFRHVVIVTDSQMETLDAVVRDTNAHTYIGAHCRCPAEGDKQ